MRIPSLALAAGLLAAGGWASGQVAPPSPKSAPKSMPLQPSTGLQSLPRGDAARQLPIVLRAQSIASQPDLETVAEGDVEFRRGTLDIRADRLSYDMARDLARASGDVRARRDGAVYSGPALELRVQRFEGFFLQPEFEFQRLGAGGSAARIDFLESGRARATDAQYTSCRRDGPDEPDWVLRAKSVTLDFDANEGVAEGAVLRFLGAPILALPTFSFPLDDSRRSGWLPPSINIDNRSGVMLSVPYYWDIAPNRDMTLAPRVMARRGLGLETELRYLEPALEGSLALDWLFRDRLTGSARHALRWQHEGSAWDGLRYSADVARVSDAQWWKDFPSASRSFTPRLLPARLGVEWPFELAASQALAYARSLRWQLAQAADSFVASPYERSPQLGLRLGGEAGGWQYSAETEYNRFTLPQGQELSTARPAGERWHVLAQLSRPLREPGWWLVPRLSVNAAHYQGLAPGSASQRAGRVIPTFSLDAGFELERRTELFGRALHQTLEPRLLYVDTPYRAQSQLPNYDSAAKDFNFVSLYSDNAFSGIDRVADAQQLTAGFTTRLVDAVSGAEALRLGLVQRYLLRTQRVAAQADGTPDGEPLKQRLSDALLVGSTSVLPSWTLDAALQYSPDSQRSVRTIVGARYSPGPFRTVSTTYRLARDLSEQLELGWQWPVFRGGGKSGSCGGNWYSVGRINYSLKDSRMTDAVIGAEYDAGCWIGRIVAEQLSTGRSEATTRLLLQLELVGLSRIGSNPLKVLKDNIPGYRLLREERGAEASSPGSPGDPTVSPSP
ncbi:LPS-assembly protein LptD [Rubrivivax sp. A210]|uniref:LPS-assembly protein LptD n=1 Tax=Rubrivivax sp. A210 TaxID=2772301 RepID=UPI00191AF045|nr:LPS assembly protein LptD [Rubrivivax sp. A210]CAD5373170.1 LPS-assembly protein LptD [Rubrivivax sp. A210]